ncbi:MAG: LysR family transcriptional regulator [Candidatus Bathyarchaeota archaeon]|nr:LysR family transcriptional regulator [Candidatus Bathyarchaeota archaeon]
MRLDYLETFLTVARTHSFSIAAKELKTSQGTVSHQIAALEEYFDAQLFKRAAGGVEVTDAGATLKETAQRILQDVQDAKAQISAAKDTLSGTIRIAASTIPEEHIIPGLIAEFQKRHPEVKFKITAQDSVTSLASLQNGGADFAAVGTLAGFEDKFDFLEIGEEQLVLITACNHTLANRKSVKLAEITQFPFISREETSGTRLEIEKLLAKNGFSSGNLKVAFELGSTESVVTAVSEGRGVSVISSIAAAKANAAGLVKVVAILEAKNPRKLYMARSKKALLKQSEAFWAFCGTYRFKSQAVVCPA